MTALTIFNTVEDVSQHPRVQNLLNQYNFQFRYGSVVRQPAAGLVSRPYPSGADTGARPGGLTSPLEAGAAGAAETAAARTDSMAQELDAGDPIIGLAKRPIGTLRVNSY